MKTRILCGLGLVVVFAVAVGFGQPTATQGQPKAAPAPTDRANAAKFLLHADPATCGGSSFAVGACRACHVSSTEGAAIGFQKYKSTEFVLLNESKTWDEKDVHSIAYKNLSGPIGQQMARVLGYEVTKDARCLTCHAVDKTPFLPLAEKMKDNTGKEFVTADGVSCVACHGIGATWQGPTGHYVTPENEDDPMPWRAKSPEYKYGKGMADLRSPAAKAQLCASCHVGNPDEGKVVTHEMYAAGHPPLPPFELGTFMECEPKHWGYPTDEKLKFFQEFAEKNPDQTWPIFRYHPAKEESYLARHVANGAIAALAAEMRTVAAEATAAADKDSTTMVDYARFDCYACHHDLKYPSPRQKRGYHGSPPGRPTLKAWVEALPGVVAEHAVGLEGHESLTTIAPQFSEKWAAVQKAAVARPFGDPGPLAEAATALADWCDQFLTAQTEIVKPVYTAGQTARLEGMIAAAVTGPWSADPEAAMHLTWAYITIRSGGENPIPEADLTAVNTAIPTRVRYPNDYNANGKPKPVADYLNARLKKFGAYEPDALIKALKPLMGGGS